jgi:hypothetical protein
MWNVCLSSPPTEPPRSCFRIQRPVILNLTQWNKSQQLCPHHAQNRQSSSMLPGNENGLNNFQGGRTILISIATGLSSVSCDDVLCKPNFAFAHILIVPSPKTTLYNPPARPSTVYPFTIYLMLQFIHTFIICIIKLRTRRGDMRQVRGRKCTQSFGEVSWRKMTNGKT